MANRANNSGVIKSPGSNICGAFYQGSRHYFQSRSVPYPVPYNRTHPQLAARDIPMSVQLDHLIVPVRDRNASAELLAALLGVPWAKSGVGPFSPVYLNEGLTLDFDQADGPFPVQHYCFRVSETEFDGIVARLIANGIEYSSTPHGPVDMQVNTQHGGRIVYWNEPDGHVWEALTISYARQPQELKEPDSNISEQPRSQDQT